MQKIVLKIAFLYFAFSSIWNASHTAVQREEDCPQTRLPKNELFSKYTNQILTYLHPTAPPSAQNPLVSCYVINHEGVHYLMPVLTNLRKLIQDSQLQQLADSKVNIDELSKFLLEELVAHCDFEVWYYLFNIFIMKLTEAVEKWRPSKSAIEHVAKILQTYVNFPGQNPSEDIRFNAGFESIKSRMEARYGLKVFLNSFLIAYNFKYYKVYNQTSSFCFDEIFSKQLTSFITNLRDNDIVKLTEFVPVNSISEDLKILIGFTLNFFAQYNGGQDKDELHLMHIPSDNYDVRVQSKMIQENIKMFIFSLVDEQQQEVEQYTYFFDCEVYDESKLCIFINRTFAIKI